MTDPNGQHAASGGPADPVAKRDKKQQQGNTLHHFRNHERRIDHRAIYGKAAETPHPRQYKTAPGAKRRRGEWVIIAMRNDSQAASSRSWSWKSALYHFSENRVHTVTSCDSLNEYAIRLMIGA